MNTTKLPPVDYLRDRFIYNRETGELRLRHKVNSKPYSSNRKDEHLRLSINNVTYLVHRVIWKIVTGKEPPEMIDHIDRDKHNNRWSNLRGCTHSENQINSDRVENAIKNIGRRAKKISPVVLARLKASLTADAVAE